MRTDEQKKSSRNNGAKSNGPVTPEGKATSARNGNRHNLAAGHLVLLSTEDPYEHVRHREAYLNRFQPADDVELDLVNKMIAASWREQRMATMEASLLEVEMERQRAELDNEFELIDGRARQTLALLGTADKQAAANLLLRYQSAARRAFTSAFKALRELQGDRFNRQPAVAPPAPEPAEEFRPTVARVRTNSAGRRSADAPAGGSPAAARRNHRITERTRARAIRLRYNHLPPDRSGFPRCVRLSCILEADSPEILILNIRSQVLGRLVREYCPGGYSPVRNPMY